ncbi:MAG TPA: ADP-ribosylglycohydrolase family protein [Lacipirellulaceae bacterium]|nr:ADP-ribosylglycohydrolase family protein [Lacipirellulaceae bacterium]
MRGTVLTLCALFANVFCIACVFAQQSPQVLTIPADQVEDKMRGGMLAQVIGNLNGRPHEFRYINHPGHVEHYTPSLPDGAVTDDDTDIEWVYLREIACSGDNFLNPDRIVALWKRHINRRIFCANRYARDLMDLGFEPPWTGNVGLNPWSDFNISGQFVCESFGLMAPAMPQTAARLGVHFTRVGIDGEPAQATQLFTTMIASAYVERDIDKILDAGLAAVDPQSEIAAVVKTVRTLCQDNPTDWKKTRREMKSRWQKRGGIVRERNGYELNTGCVIAALIYGHNDFVETLRTAFNFGWDADCDAATAATVVGVMKGRRWMNQQGWDIKDIYRNTSRDDMPNDETLTGLENTLIQAARITIRRAGGEIIAEPSPSKKGSASEPSPSGKNITLEPSPAGRGQGEGALPAAKLYRIPAESPANIEPLATVQDQRARLRAHFQPQIKLDLTAPGVARARAAYLAICLDESEKWKRESPQTWSAAIAELQNHASIVRDLFHAPKPLGDNLRRKAEQAGLHDPKHIKLTERPLED